MLFLQVPASSRFLPCMVPRPPALRAVSDHTSGKNPALDHQKRSHTPGAESCPPSSSRILGDAQKQQTLSSNTSSLILQFCSKGQRTTISKYKWHCLMKESPANIKILKVSLNYLTIIYQTWSFSFQRDYRTILIKENLEKSVGGSTLITICRWEKIQALNLKFSLVLKLPMCLHKLHHKYFPSYTDLGSVILSLIV